MKTKARPTSRFFLNLSAILAVIALGLFLTGVFSTTGQAVYVAVVGPMTGPDQATGEDMARSVNLYPEQATAHKLDFYLWFRYQGQSAAPLGYHEEIL
jgi:hypothetical protein